MGPANQHEANYEIRVRQIYLKIPSHTEVNQQALTPLTKSMNYHIILQIKVN